VSEQRTTVFVISCEHGGREVPASCAAIFSGMEAVLDSHRGWDPGALELGVQMADALGARLHAATTTRLLVDLNRSIGHRQLFSEATRALPVIDRDQLLDLYYRPHRASIEDDIARHVAHGRRVIHIASHSFTPVLEGVERTADIGWLYDPRRPAEVAFAGQWMHAMAQADALRLRRNYPYHGRNDGLTALLRKRHANDAYAGIELEVNQQFFLAGGLPWERLRENLVRTLSACAGRLQDSPDLTRLAPPRRSRP